jgi:CBS domain-containing protein
MRVEEVMSEATGCEENDSVRQCAKLMKDEDIGFVPVCDAQGAPIGAVTDRDLAIRVLAEGRSADEKVSAIMTRNVVGCRVGDDVEKAMELMRNERTQRVMVCDDQGKLKGVISLQDLAEETEEEQVGETVQEVKSDTPPAMH